MVPTRLIKALQNDKIFYLLETNKIAKKQLDAWIDHLDRSDDDGTPGGIQENIYDFLALDNESEENLSPFYEEVW